MNDWQRKIKREHVVTFIPAGAKPHDGLVDKVCDGLTALGYEVPGGGHPISIGWGPVPDPRFEVVYGDADRIGLDSWESAVVCALAQADAFGQVIAQTRTTIIPAVFLPEC